MKESREIEAAISRAMHAEEKEVKFANRDAAVAGIEKLEAERDELRAEVARLKADKERMDWAEKNVHRLPALSEAWGELPDTFRDVLDAAMKGDK